MNNFNLHLEEVYYNVLQVCMSCNFHLDLQNFGIFFRQITLVRNKARVMWNDAKVVEFWHRCFKMYPKWISGVNWRKVFSPSGWAVRRPPLAEKIDVSSGRSLYVITMVQVCYTLYKMMFLRVVCAGVYDI